MNFRVVAVVVLVAIFAIGVYLNTDKPASSPGSTVQQHPASKEDDAMKNLKIN